MSLVTDRKDGYTALTIDANPIYPAAAWAHKFELNTANTTGLTFDIYARKTPSSTERCFNIAFTEVEEGGLKVLYPLAVNEATANSFNRKNVVVTCQFTEDATGNVYILYEDYVDVGIGSIENVIEVPEVGGTITVSDGDYGDVVVSGNGLVWTVTSGSSIADDLVTNDPTKSLSAAQGVVLKSLVDGKATSAQGALADSALQSVSQGDVTAHQSALSITESQISDLGAYITDYTVTESDVTTAIDGATLTSATVAATDKVLLQDADDSDNLKTVTAQSIADLGAGGGVDWTTTQTSAKADGASNTAFEFSADSNYTLGKLFHFYDSSGGVYYKNGLLYLTESAYSTTYIGQLNAHQTGLHLSYNSKNLVWTGSNTTTDDDFVNFSYHGLKFVTGTPATIGYNPPEGDQATTSLTISAQSALPSATTNQDGADLTLLAGSKATGGGSNGNILMTNLPTSDPSVTGALWNDSGTLKISL
ncbi:hypothetical protein OAA08_00990 [bacterium]|nr:hypothetical protein [bacterium]